MEAAAREEREKLLAEMEAMKRLLEKQQEEKLAADRELEALRTLAERRAQAEVLRGKAATREEREGSFLQ